MSSPSIIPRRAQVFRWMAVAAVTAVVGPSAFCFGGRAMMKWLDIPNQARMRILDQSTFLMTEEELQHNRELLERTPAKRQWVC